MKFASRLTVALTVGLMTCFCVVETTVLAQNIGRSYVGNGSLVGALNRAETRAELGLSEDDIRKLQEAVLDATSSRNVDVRVLSDKLRNAGSDQERERVRQQMRDSQAERNKKAEEAVAKVIGPEKMRRLKQLVLQYEGRLALMRDDVAADLNLTDSQKAKLAELMRQSSQARREMGFRISPVKRAAFDKEWDDKFFSILTEEQRAKWEQKLGRILAQTARVGSPPIGASSVVSALYHVETRAELGLSDDEISKLQEATSDAMSSDRDERRAQFNKLRNAGSDEERERVRQQMRDSRAERNKKAEEAIVKLIGAEKLLRLKQLALQYEGRRALIRDDIAADLNLTEAQKAKLVELMNQSSQARRELGSPPSEEDRAAFDKEWNEKFFSILTDEQKAKWAQKVGRIVPQTGQTHASGRPAVSQSTARSNSEGFSSGIGAPYGFVVGGVWRALYRDETRTQLGLSEDEIRKLQEASRKAMTGGDDITLREMLEKIRNATSDEEREKIQKEYRDAYVKRSTKADEAIAKSIGAEKMLRLKQLALQYEGADALRRDDVAADLSITEAQKAKLEDLMKQRRDAFREMGFPAGPETRASFDKEWNDKIFSILTDEQKAKWTQKLGRIVAQTGQAPDGGTPSPSRTTGRSNSGRFSSGIGGRGSFGGSTIGRNSGVVGALYHVETRAELGLSDDEISKLQEAARDAVSSDSADMRLLLDKMRNAGSDEEREKIQKEMRDANVERGKRAEEAIAKALGPEKMLRLKQLALQYEGSRALTRDDVAADLNITDAQKARFAELRNQAIQARRELGFRASREERASFEKEWEDKYFSVLSDEQRAKWEQKVGRIVKQTGRTVGTARAGGAGGPSPSNGPTTASGPARGGANVFGRTFSGSSGVLSALYREETRADLGLSEDEIRKLQESSRDTIFGGDDNGRRELSDKLRNASSDEERERIQKEIQDFFAERRKKAEEAIAKSIGAERMLRLKQLALQYEGGRALSRDNIAADLNITDAQKAKLEDLSNQRRDAFREMGFRANPEERAAFDKEWNGKYFSVLTDEQRAKWEQKVGRIVTPRGRTGDNDGREPK